MSIIQIAKICSFETSSLDIFLRHRLDTHRLHGRKTNLDNEMSKKVEHACSICELKIIHDDYAISEHLQRKHPVPIGLKRGAPTIKSAYILKNISKFQFNAANKFKILAPCLEVQDEKDKKMSSVLNNKCIFACNICQGRYHSWEGLVNHLVRTHDSRAKKAQMENYLVKMVYDSCKICGENILKGQFPICVPRK